MLCEVQAEAASLLGRLQERERRGESAVASLTMALLKASQAEWWHSRLALRLAGVQANMGTSPLFRQCYRGGQSTLAPCSTEQSAGALVSPKLK